MSYQLAEAAKRLGSDTVIMDSYWKYHEREQNWFFSPNYNLDNATKRPAPFPREGDWDQLNLKERKETLEKRKKVWDGFSSKQRMTIATLAGFGYEGRGINLENSHHFSRLREGYNKWRSDLYSVFWSDDNVGKRWLCNVFVGDAIYLYNKRSFTSANQHYFDPKQIYAGHSTLHKRRNIKDVQVGDIVVFGSYHVEIIVELRKNQMFFSRFKADDGFCSIGAVRGDSPFLDQGDGKLRCDSASTISSTRELDNSEHSYFFI